MKRIGNLLAACLLITLCACTKADNKQEPISVLAPQGAPALATLSLSDKENVIVDTVSGSDPLSAELIKNDGRYDVIIAPINLGAKLMEKEATPYRLAAIITWGNLYVVGDAAYKNGDSFAAFGENAVPGKILSTYANIDNVNYFSSVQDVQAQLLSGKVKAGLLAEPAATATIAKAKEKGIKLSVLTDLQEKESKDHQKGYPQAAIFVKDKDKTASVLQDIETFLNEGCKDEQKVSAYIEKIGADQLGIPNAKIALASWQHQNLKFVKADAVTNDIAEFLKLFKIVFDEGMLI